MGLATALLYPTSVGEGGLRALGRGASTFFPCGTALCSAGLWGQSALQHKKRGPCCKAGRTQPVAMRLRAEDVARLNVLAQHLR